MLETLMMSKKKVIGPNLPEFTKDKLVYDFGAIYSMMNIQVSKSGTKLAASYFKSTFANREFKVFDGELDNPSVFTTNWAASVYPNGLAFNDDETKLFANPHSSAKPYIFEMETKTANPIAASYDSGWYGDHVVYSDGSWVTAGGGRGYIISEDGTNLFYRTPVGSIRPRIGLLDNKIVYLGSTRPYSTTDKYLTGSMLPVQDYGAPEDYQYNEMLFSENYACIPYSPTSSNMYKCMVILPGLDDGFTIPVLEGANLSYAPVGMFEFEDEAFIYSGKIIWWIDREGRDVRVIKDYQSENGISIRYVFEFNGKLYFYNNSPGSYAIYRLT